MRALAGIDSSHPGVFDAEFFFQEGHFLAETIIFGLESHPGIPAVSGPTAGAGSRVLSQTADVQDRESM